MDVYKRVTPRAPEGGLSAMVAWTGLPFSVAFFASIAHRNFAGGDKTFSLLTFATTAMLMKGVGVNVQALEVATGCFAAALAFFAVVFFASGER
jgi:hypothetical protein